MLLCIDLQEFHLQHANVINMNNNLPQIDLRRLATFAPSGPQLQEPPVVSEITVANPYYSVKDLWPEQNNVHAFMTAISTGLAKLKATTSDHALQNLLKGSHYRGKYSVFIYLFIFLRLLFS